MRRPRYLFTSNAKRARLPAHPCCVDWKAGTNQRHSSSVFIFSHNEKPTLCINTPPPSYSLLLYKSSPFTRSTNPSILCSSAACWINISCFIVVMIIIEKSLILEKAYNYVFESPFCCAAITAYARVTCYHPMIPVFLQRSKVYGSTMTIHTDTLASVWPLCPPSLLCIMHNASFDPFAKLKVYSIPVTQWFAFCPLESRLDILNFSAVCHMHFSDRLTEYRQHWRNDCCLCVCVTCVCVYFWEKNMAFVCVFVARRLVLS